jgi:hypothetical protein
MRTRLDFCRDCYFNSSLIDGNIRISSNNRMLPVKQERHNSNSRNVSDATTAAAAAAY